MINLADEPEEVLWEKLLAWQVSYEAAAAAAGHKVLFIALHRDECKIKDLEADDDPAHLEDEWRSFEYTEDDGSKSLKKIKYNIHAHVVIDRTTIVPQTGQQRILTLDKKKLREIQNLPPISRTLGAVRNWVKMS